MEFRMCESIRAIRTGPVISWASLNGTLSKSLNLKGLSCDILPLNIRILLDSTYFSRCDGFSNFLITLVSYWNRRDLNILLNILGSGSLGEGLHQLQFAAGVLWPTLWETFLQKKMTLLRILNVLNQPNLIGSIMSVSIFLPSAGLDILVVVWALCTDISGTFFQPFLLNLLFNTRWYRQMRVFLNWHVF